MPSALRISIAFNKADSRYNSTGSNLRTSLNRVQRLPDEHLRRAPHAARNQLIDSRLRILLHLRGGFQTGNSRELQPGRKGEAI
jgi:hypothetical protein